MHRLNLACSGHRGGQREEKRLRALRSDLGISWESQNSGSYSSPFWDWDSIPGKPTRLKYRLNAKHFEAGFPPVCLLSGSYQWGW